MLNLINKETRQILLRIPAAVSSYLQKWTPLARLVSFFPPVGGGCW